MAFLISDASRLRFFTAARRLDREYFRLGISEFGFAESEFQILDVRFLSTAPILNIYHCVAIEIINWREGFFTAARRLLALIILLAPTFYNFVRTDLQNPPSVIFL